MKDSVKVTVEALEAYLKNRYGGWANEQGLFMKLVEEMGEAAEVLNMRSGCKSKNDEDLQTQLGYELADIIHYVVAIAAINDIDLNSVIISKDKTASVKYHHDTNLETFIRERET